MIDLPKWALSVRQPWAYALAMGWKPVENRSWRRGNPGMQFRGPFAIHASKGMTRDEYDEAADTFAACGVQCPPPAELLRGGIIGIGCIADIVSAHESPWFFGPKALVIEGATPIDFIPVGGRLGFFEWRALLPHRKTDEPTPPARWMLPDNHKPHPSATRPAPAPVDLVDAPDDGQGRLF